MGSLSARGVLRRALLILYLLAIASGGRAAPAVAQDASASKPFRLPFLEPAGVGTWYLAQGYGNTIGAFGQRYITYQAGQGLHFGVDFAAPCGTPVVAIGDGIVAKVDAPEHRAEPHNLMINHPNGYASFYGHLLERPNLRAGQAVRRGQVVALSGDSYGTCHSAPHLHLEIRDQTYRVAYNPVPLIDADWDNLALMSHWAVSFERDLDDPHRWQSLDDQPAIQMGGPLLNDYAHAWPPDWR